MANKPHVQLLATGGTIANPMDIEGYLTGEELLDEVPEVGEVADVEIIDVASTGSSGISFDVWLDLQAQISASHDGGNPPDGFVVTHGSNTVEETAYFLHLTAETDRPVVLTAAQRNHRLIGNDGDRNLLDAVKVAGSDEARGRGAMVVLNDEIHSAREVTKNESHRPDAWTSGNFGVLGLVDKRDNLGFYRRTMHRHAPDTEFDLAGVDAEDLPRVDVVYCAADMDGGMVDAAVDNGADGIVLAGLPTGAAAQTGQATAARRAHREGTPVVNSHRGLTGWPSKNKDYIWGNTITPQKARILLTLALLETDDYAEVERMFQEY